MPSRIEVSIASLIDFDHLAAEANLKGKAGLRSPCLINTCGITPLSDSLYGPKSGCIDLAAPRTSSQDRLSNRNSTARRAHHMSLAARSRELAVRCIDRMGMPVQAGLGPHSTNSLPAPRSIVPMPPLQVSTRLRLQGSTSRSSFSFSALHFFGGNEWAPDRNSSDDDPCWRRTRRRSISVLPEMRRALPLKCSVSAKAPARLGCWPAKASTQVAAPARCGGMGRRLWRIAK
jgi:hypothetical protein